MSRKITRYALVGAGGRAVSYIDPLVTRFKKTNELVAICDTNPGRMEFHNERLAGELGYHEVAAYLAEDFDRMVRETRPDVVLVCCVDAFHHRYIIRAMELGCDVVTEKPLTIDERKCRAVLRTVERTGRKVRVTLNFRWAQGPALVKRLLSRGTIGEVLHVDMEYLLNTSHGADYFRRWHREKDKSGGLMVHKSTHHFDLISWLIDAVPEQVFGYGRLAFYGKKNAEKRGVKVKYDRYTGHDTTGDPFALKLDGGTGKLRRLYHENEKYDGYLRDRNVFGEGITAEDTMSVLVKYRTGVVLNYSLNAYVPREGVQIVFNGTQGRLEYHEAHGSHIIAGQSAAQLVKDTNWRSRCIIHPLFSKAYEVKIPTATGEHGGADRLMTEQLFSTHPPRDKWGRNAGHEQGAASILIGIAANKCFKTGRPVTIAKLCPGLGRARKLSELD